MLHRSALTALAVVGFSSELLALGASNISLELSSARSGGQGYVGTAGQNEDPNVVFANAAGLTELTGTQLTLGTHFVGLRGEYEPASGAAIPMRSSAPVPNFALTRRLQERLAIGLSVQAPYGMGLKWPSDSPLRFVTTESKMAALFVTPGIAYKLDSRLSIGGGVSYVRVLGTKLGRSLSVDGINLVLASQGLGAPTIGSPDAPTTFDGSGDGLGYHAGVLFKPSPRHAFGIAYRSGVKATIDGTLDIARLSGGSALVFGGSSYSTGVSSVVRFPANLQLGYAVTPNAKWMLEADAAWFRWSTFRDLELEFAESDPLRSVLLNTGNPVLLEPSNGWSLGAGVNYRHDERLQLRAGGMWLPYALPDRTFHPAFFDLRRRSIGAGIGYGLSSRASLDVSYSAVFMPRRDIRNDVGTAVSGLPATGIPPVGVPSPDISGGYRNFAHLLGFNLTYRWSGR